VLFAFLPGCNTGFVTPSGSPEVIIENASLEEVQDILVRQMIIWGFVIERRWDKAITFEKQETRLVYRSGVEYPETTKFRVTFNLGEESDGVWMMAKVLVTSDPGTDYEKTVDESFGGPLARDIQNFFNHWKAKSVVN
jgi:hypothetical protein